MALKRTLICWAYPSALIDALASPHFLLRSWMSCLILSRVFLFTLVMILPTLLQECWCWFDVCTKKHTTHTLKKLLRGSCSFFFTIPNEKRNSLKTFIEFMMFYKVVPSILIKKLRCTFPGFGSQQITGQLIVCVTVIWFPTDKSCVLPWYDSRLITYLPCYNTWQDWTT